jgi:hypothetical protein
MSGTKAGGLKCAAKNKLIHGDDFYKRIGSIGGKVRNPNKGFGSNHDRAIAAGCKGRTQRDINNEYKRLIIKFNMLGI